MNMHADVIGDMRRVLRNQFLQRFEATVSESSRKTYFSAVLVAFWHATLTCASRCEQFAIDEAARYRAANNLRTSPWNLKQFSAYLNDLYNSRFDALSENPDEFFAHFRSNMGIDFVFFFLSTMRFENWFPVENFKVNYSMQILLRFEETYLPGKLHRNAETLLDRSLNFDDSIVNRIWRRIVHTNSVMLNSSFAFFLYAVLGTPASNSLLGASIYWDETWRVTNIFTCSGSYIVTEETKYYDGLPTNDINGLQETTWIVLLLTSNVGHSRMVNCSLSTPDAKQNIFLRPLLPFFIIDKPLLSSAVLQLLNNPRMMRQHMENYFIAEEVVVMLNGCLADNQFEANKTSYQVDEVCEIQPIGHRIVILFDMIAKSTNDAIFLRKQLKKIAAKTASKKKLVARAELEKKCKEMQDTRDDNIALFVLLLQLQKFYAQ